MTIPDIGQRPRVPAATEVLVLSAASAPGCYLLALALPAPHTWLLIPFATGTGLLIALAGGLEQAWMRILSAVLLAACVLAAVLIGSAALFSWSFAPLVFVHLPAAVTAWMHRRKAMTPRAGAGRR